MMRWLRAAAIGTSLLGLAGLQALASTPRLPIREPPLVPANVRSVVVGEAPARVWLWPSTRSAARGILDAGVKVPYMGIAMGDGCRGPFYRVDAEGYVCGDYAMLSTEAPDAPRFPIVPEGKLLPWEYGFAREDGVKLYRDVNRFGGDMVKNHDRELLKGYALALKEKKLHQRRNYWVTLHKLHASPADLNLAQPSPFVGVSIVPGQPSPAWAVSVETSVHVAAGGGRGTLAGKVPRLSLVQVVEEAEVRGNKWYRIGERQWVLARKIRRMRPADPPASVAENEKWVDVDVEQQIVTAYEGRRPVYATVVSTGRDPNVTLPGEFRIYGKLAATTMDNSDDMNADEFYSVEDVPWTEFFEQSYALHGAYWHDGFGYSRSHGCVNLAPRDARWFYEWTEPRMPDGWVAVYSTRQSPGTLVRVRQPENQIPEPILKALAIQHRRRDRDEDPPRPSPLAPLID